MRAFKFLLTIQLAQALLTNSSYANTSLIQSSSSLPEPGLPMAIEVNKSFEKNIRVKVFPHDLRSDWVHGVPDDPRALTLKGALIVEGWQTESLKVRLDKDMLIATLDNGESIAQKRITVVSEDAISLIRKKNLDKSHSYRGNIELIARAGKILAVNTLDIEDYLRGVVPKESVSTWPLEALKAQAVAARTYAYYHLLTSKREHFDVDDTARFQVYAGESAAIQSTNLAIEESRSQVLTHKGKVIVAFFHAYSGGRTDSAKNIFGNIARYCLGNAEIFSREELKNELKPSSRWIVEWTTDWMKRGELMRKLKASSHSKALFKSFSANSSFEIFESKINPQFKSAKEISFKQNTKSASLYFTGIRKVLGWSNFPSYHFRLIENQEGMIAFKGHGWGHHVGLSQWGAFIMAKNYQKTYEEILYHYYHDVSLSIF